MKKFWTIALTALITAVVVFFTTVMVMEVRLRLEKNKWEQSQIAAYDDLTSESDKLKEIRSLVDRVFIGDIDETYMTEKLSAAMIEGLNDEWSYYIPADEYASYVENVTNSYVGIGVSITLPEEDPKGLNITEVTPGSPAEAAGLVIGDVITKVEGESTVELGMNESKNRVRGEAGTSVTLTILRDGEEFDVTIVRDSIKVVNVTWEMMDDVGYIRIRNFEQNCAKDSIEAIEAVMDQGAKGIVFDLRFNPGGLKNELVHLLDYILPEGVLFRAESYTGAETVDKSNASCIEIPMAVLVNKDSYSAAEFFAAALQDYDYATIVGTQTYGKGYFQQCITLTDGSAVNVSTGKYFTPKGNSLIGVGITPDLVVEISDEEYTSIYYGKMAHEDDVQLIAALEAAAGK